MDEEELVGPSRVLDKVYCRNRSSDGRICILYKGHYGPHAEKHLKSYWPSDNLILDGEDL